MIEWGLFDSDKSRDAIENDVIGQIEWWCVILKGRKHVAACELIGTIPC
jgi:hypothetical protein